MTDFTGKLIANTYKDILTIATSVENSGIDSTLRRVQDGSGNNSPLKLSETSAAFTGNVSINGNLKVNGSFQPDTVDTNELQATRIVATSITTNTLNAGTLTFQDVSVSTLRAGTVSATNINGTNITVDGDRVITSAIAVSAQAIFAAEIRATIANTSAALQQQIDIVSVGLSATNTQTQINATQINTLSTSITANASAIAVNSAAITSINGVLADGGAFASAGTSATLETRIAAVSSTMATSISNKVSKSGDTMTGDLSFGDNNKINLGAGSDLNLYHDGSDSIIEDTGTGDLIIKASQRIWMKGINDETLIRSTENSQISLYHNNLEKLSTLTGGIIVYGGISAARIGAGGINYPTSDGTANQVIKTDGAGTLSFTSVITDGSVFASAGTSAALESRIAGVSSTMAASIASTSAALESHINIVSAALSIANVSIAANSSQIAAVSVLTKTNKDAITSINGVLGDGSAYASAGTSATLQTKIAAVSSTMATSIANVRALVTGVNASAIAVLQTSVAANASAIAVLEAATYASANTSATLETRIASVSSTMATSIANVRALVTGVNASAITVLQTSVAANSSAIAVLEAATYASANTSATLETRIATVSSTLATSIANSNAAIAAVSSTMATSINNSNAAITSVNTRINSVSVLAETKASAATSANLETRINAVSVLTQTNKTSIAANASAIAVLQGATYASAGTSATLESRIAGVSSTMATSISNSNSAIATLSATMATSIANHLRLSGGTLTGSLTLNADPSTNLQAATKAYVDNLTASSIHVHEAVRVETNTTNLNATYNNGTGGVGATLTNAGTQAALVIDGVTLNTSDRVLVIGQTNQTQNGVYVVTDTGSASTNWILTRSDDADTFGDGSPDTLDEGSYFFVQEGTIGAAHSFVCNTQGTIVFGTTNITFAQFSDSVEYTAGTGINVNASRVISTSGVATTGQLTALSATLATSIANVSATLESRIATVSALIPTSLTELGIVDGTAGQYLQTNANGTYSFTSVAGGGSGISNITAGTNIALTQNGVTVTDTTTSATINVVGVASAGTSAALESRIASVSSAMATSINNSNAAITALSATMATSINNSNTNIAAVSVLTKTNKDAITSINGVLGDGSTFASAGTSATLQTKIATLSATMATSIGNSNTAIATLSATMATSIGNRTAAITSVNTRINAVSVLTKTNKDAITSINSFISAGAYASIGTSATLQTKINTVSSTMATSINNSNTAIATLSATMATSINNRTAAITSVNTKINAVSVLTKTNKDAITSINGVLGDGSAYASAGTSATLQTKIATLSATMATSINNRTAAITSVNTRINSVSVLTKTNKDAITSINAIAYASAETSATLQTKINAVSATMATSINNSNTAIATLSATMATSISNHLPLAGGTVTGTITASAVVAPTPINTQTGTTYTTSIGDASRLVTLNNGSAITVTIPPNSSVAYSVGTKIDFAQIGAGQVTFVGGAGVSIGATPTLKLRDQHSASTCIKLATDTWLLVGDLAES